MTPVSSAPERTTSINTDDREVLAAQVKAMYHLAMSLINENPDTLSFSYMLGDSIRQILDATRASMIGAKVTRQIQHYEWTDKNDHGGTHNRD